MKKALLIRLDRLGDLILTLPCDQILADTHQVQWAIPQGLDFVCQTSVPQRRVQSFGKEGNLKNFLSFYRWVRSMQPHLAIVYHAPWWISFALFIAGVPRRAGVLSQWHSYLFLNHGLRQKRSRCEMHEFEYNVQLTQWALEDHQKKDVTPLRLEPTKIDLPFDCSQKYFVVHPGMGGSALNWPTSHYAQLISELSTKATVVITGTAGDAAYVEPLKQILKNNPNVVWLDKQLSGYQLLKLLKYSLANIAPSTGVIHLSAALGAPSLGVYSPIQVHQPQRWGPRGDNVTTYVPPQIQCPSQFECLKEECPHYDCMAKIPISSLVQKAASFIPST